MEKRSYRISLRLSEEEKKLIDEWGTDQGLDTALALRACGLLYLRGYTREI